jgi:hypothetical protein
MSRSRGKKELLHPIFLECRDKTDNEFWKSLYEDMAYGKYPKQIYINQNQQINSTNRSNSFQYDFKDKTVDEMVIEIQELLLTHTNLISNDEINIKKTSNIQYKKDTWTNWKDIKKKYIRDVLLMDYCLEIKRLLTFSSNETIYLYERLSNLILYGQLSTVHLDNNKIVAIDGVDIHQDTNCIIITCDTYKEELSFPIPDMMSHYCKRYLLRTSKFITDFNKK